MLVVQKHDAESLPVNGLLSFIDLSQKQECLTLVDSIEFRSSRAGHRGSSSCAVSIGTALAVVAALTMLSQVSDWVESARLQFKTPCRRCRTYYDYGPGYDNFAADPPPHVRTQLRHKPEQEQSTQAACEQAGKCITSLLVAISCRETERNKFALVPPMPRPSSLAGASVDENCRHTRDDFINVCSRSHQVISSKR